MLRGVERILADQSFKRRSPKSGFISTLFEKHKKKILSYSTLCIVGAFFVWIVVFSVTAPARPENSLVNALKEVSVTNNVEGEAVGAGPVNYERKVDISYKVKKGETLSEIAYSFDLSLSTLTAYNSITNSKLIHPGDTIIIPSLTNGQNLEEKLAFQSSKPLASGKGNVKVLPAQVELTKTPGVRGLSVRFKITDPKPETLTNVEWDFGDGRKSFNSETYYDYLAPKTYRAKVTARDTKGQTFKSEVIIDVPHPDTSIDHTSTRYFTLSSPDEPLVVNGQIEKVSNYKSISTSPLTVNDMGDGNQQITFKKPGYFGLTVNENGESRIYSVFVSPIPSIHSERTDLNWYRTQFNTSTPSNCGPTSVSIGIGYSTGKYLSVADVRTKIGWTGNGSTSFEDLLSVLKSNNVHAYVQKLTSAQDIRDIVDKKGIAIILFDTTYLDQGPMKDFFGKYYNDNVGHYIVIKGYSLNGEYLISYDPIPSDWGSNNLRYDDGMSMIGKNRYYSTKSIMSALRRHEAIVVPSPAN